MVGMRLLAVMVLGCSLAGGVAGWTVTPGLTYAQAPTINSQMRHARGQSVVPFYEGWYEDADGRAYASYGYVNLNLEEMLDIPVGPDNAIAPDLADQGQPTHLLPGHQKGVFVVTLPKERSATEVTWTLSVRGETMSVPSNLGPLYQIEGLITHGGSFPGNTPPVLKFAPDGASGKGPRGLTRATVIETTVQTEVPLDVWVSDDGLPGKLDPFVVRSAQTARRRRQGRAGPGVSVTWSKYRGAWRRARR